MIATLIQKRTPLVSRLQPAPAPHSNPPAYSLQPPASRRRGISLMEVLMAIFVLTTGLLGIAMVIPAGRALMVEASKNDRGSACGRAALNEIQIRQWYDSSQWKQKWSEGLGASVRDARVDGRLLYGETYFLDPYFFVYDTNDTTDTIRHFPYVAYPEREFSFVSSSALRQWPDRALARRVAFPTNFVSEAVAERLTTWADELIFSIENDGSRPRQMYTWTDGKSWASPSRAGDDSTFGATDIALRPADEGRFTWAAMITPIVPPKNNGATTALGSPPVPLVNPVLISKYEVSIVVFYKRQRNCPVADPDIRTPASIDLIRERSVYARLDGGGIGGGDVLLFVPDGDASRPAGYLDLRKNDWIMLKGLDLAGQVGGGTTGVRFTCPTVCKWYRVVGVDDLMTAAFPDPNNISGSPLTGRGRYVTLAGPDWNVDTVSTAGPTSPDGFDWSTDIAEAALIKDVVGVYTTIIDTNTL